jgi:hypothetical protein
LGSTSLCCSPSGGGGRGIRLGPQPRPDAVLAQGRGPSRASTPARTGWSGRQPACQPMGGISQSAPARYGRPSSTDASSGSMLARDGSARGSRRVRSTSSPRSPLEEGSSGLATMTSATRAARCRRSIQPPIRSSATFPASEARRASRSARARSGSPTPTAGRLLQADPGTARVERIAELSPGSIHPVVGAGSIWSSSAAAWGCNQRRPRHAHRSADPQGHADAASWRQRSFPHVRTWKRLGRGEHRVAHRAHLTCGVERPTD